MPFYNYKCSKCGFEWDESRKVSEMNEPCEKPCPNCKEENFIEIVIGAIRSVWNCSKPTL